MRVRPLILDPPTRAAIAAADARARAAPLPWAVLQEFVQFKDLPHVTLADRRGGEPPRSEQVLIEYGYRAAISYEMQPAGLIKHLSISVDEPGKLPHPLAIQEIMAAFGIEQPDNAWLEEFDPGHEAINIVKVVGPSDVPSGTG